MKLLCLACLHGDEKFLKVPLEGIDAVLIAGDLGKADKSRLLRMKYPDASSLSDKISSQELAEMMEENIGSAEKLLKHFSKNQYTLFMAMQTTQKILLKIRTKNLA